MRLRKRKKQEEAPPPQENARRGLYHLEAEGNGLLNRGADLNFMAEIEEIETVGGLTRVRVKNVTGSSSPQENLGAMALLPQWLPTKSIIWIDPPRQTRVIKIVVRDDGTFDVDSRYARRPRIRELDTLGAVWEEVAQQLKEAQRDIAAGAPLDAPVVKP